MAASSSLTPSPLNTASAVRAGAYRHLIASQQRSFNPRQSAWLPCTKRVNCPGQAVVTNSMVLSPQVSFVSAEWTHGRLSRHRFSAKPRNVSPTFREVRRLADLPFFLVNGCVSIPVTHQHHRLVHQASLHTLVLWPRQELRSLLIGALDGLQPDGLR